MGNLHSKLGNRDPGDQQLQTTVKNEPQIDEDKSLIFGLPNLVMSKIFCYLEYKVLRDCRLVCNHWEQLLQSDQFSDDNICCRYPPTNTAKPHENSKITGKCFRTSLRSKERRLMFTTMRLTRPHEFSQDYLQEFSSTEPFLDGLKRDIYKLNSPLKCVTRLEIISTMLTLGDYNKLKDISYVLSILKSFSNLKELIVAEKEQNFISSISEFNSVASHGLESNYGLTFPDLYKKGYDLKTIKKLKKLFYSVDLLSAHLNNYLDFLRVMANTCEELVEFEIRIDYSYIWSIGLAMDNLYELLGILLKRNATSLEKVHIGVRNVWWSDDKLMDTGAWGQTTNRFGVELLLDGNRPENYIKFTLNEMYERLFDEMRKNKWDEFGLKMNALEFLTLEFPLPVLPTKNIDLGLKPFVNSLGSLKTLKIQPIFATKGRDQDGSTICMPVPYLANLFVDKKSWNRANLASDIVFLKYAPYNLSWTTLHSQRREELWGSALDLVFKKKKGELKPRCIRWRNVSWRRVDFRYSMVRPHLTLGQLTRLVIHQNLTSSEADLQMNNSDFQLIISEGISLKCLILNCGLDRVTPFGYSGHHLINVNTLQMFIEQKGQDFLIKSKRGYLISDLKYLTCLILIGLRGNYANPNTSREIKEANFNFLMEYFTLSGQVKYLILGFEEEFARLRRVKENGEVHFFGM